MLALFHFSDLEFSFSATNCLRLLVLVSLMFLVASALSAVFSTTLSLAFTLLLSVILGIVHQTKLALTNEPLSWTDISSGRHLSIALHYARGWHGK